MLDTPLAVCYLRVMMTLSDAEASGPLSTASGEPATPRAVPTLAVTTDVVTFSIRPDRELLRADGDAEPGEEGGSALHVLLVKYDRGPFAGRWGLPGDFVRPDESLNASAARALAEGTGLRPAYLEQLYTFGLPERHAGQRLITVAYYALVRVDELELPANWPSDQARWWPVDRLPQPLAYDHASIIAYALWRLRNKVSYAHVAFQFLPPTFTIAQLRAVYEVILGRRLDPTNFRRKVAATGTIVPTRQRVAGGRHRPPQLYRCAAEPNTLYQGPSA